MHSTPPAYLVAARIRKHPSRIDRHVCEAIDATDSAGLVVEPPKESEPLADDVNVGFLMVVLPVALCLCFKAEVSQARASSRDWEFRSHSVRRACVLGRSRHDVFNSSHAARLASRRSWRLPLLSL
mmetsp:Transcript_1163/g.3073  ORF Transcript_1163/g.3073 Transcript_1163/m.3073 type:complete len:126 (-) Transcript_1163:466-843(-)